MIDRRMMLKTTAGIGATMAFAASLPGLRAMAQTTPPLRRSLKDMDLDDQVLQTYREFITMMKDPSRNGQPVSWTGFSDIHGTAAAFNFCPHRNWYFLPWHRGYIRMYEVAVRALTGDTDFAMPYWDWTEQPDFPAALGDAMIDGQPNAMFVQGRAMQTGDQMATGITGQAVMDIIYGNQTYEEFGSSRPEGQNSHDPSWIMSEGFQGELESNPHNNVHCDVAGPFMCAGNSPMDPTFQMHHCNIDRIWAVWNSMGGANSDDTLWTDMPFTDNFIDPQGNAYTDVVNQLFDVEALGYTYGLGIPPVAVPEYPGRTLYLAALYGAPLALESVGPERMIASVDKSATPDNPLSVTLEAKMSALESAITPQAISTLEAANLPTRVVYAFIRKMSPSNGGGTQLRVFVNAEGADADTETVGNPNYVTSIGFFGPNTGHNGHDMRPSVAVNLTPALRKLNENKPLESDMVTVQLVPVSQHEGQEPGSVDIAEIELAIV